MKTGYSMELSEEGPADRLPSSTEPSLTSHQNGMTSVESHLLQNIESLRTRLSKLSEASLRVSETLDVNTVLKEVIDNARDLTGARYGALLTYEQSGGIQEFLTSGLSAEEIERLNVLPKGLGLLGYMNEIREPLRLADISSHPNSVGFPENHPPMKTFLGMPIRHRGEHVGNIYLTEKEGGKEFTSEDQDVLVMFASQAGAAIFNARRYQEEQQAKADLEALVNISPVGVLVFDAETGDLVSANDETRRIVGNLHAPGRSLSQLLEVMSLRRPDGSDIPMDQLPTTKALRHGESVLAEEVVIHLQDGRTISTLVNARPIRRDGGDIVSVVATIQDITPLEEMKKQRAEFLNNVSHELRTPLTSIKGSASTLLNSPYPVDPVENRQFLRVIDEQTDRMRDLINDLVDITHIEAGTLSVSPEPVELADLLDQVREVHSHVGAPNSRIEFELTPALPKVMADSRRVLQVLSNLVASVSMYSSETSTVRIRVFPRDSHVAFTVGDETAGAAAIHSATEPGKNSRNVHQILGTRTGRGDMGIAICRGIIEAHGGRLTIEQGDAGERGGFMFTIPVVAQQTRVEQSPDQSQPIPDSDEGRARILAIVEDPETSRYVRNILSQERYTTIVVNGSIEAGRLIEEQNPDVILLDPMLPWTDGFEVLVRIGRVSDTPVILVAGHDWHEHIGRAFELGAFDYIAKPFTTTELLARVDLALRRRGSAGWRESSANYLHDGLSIDYAERKVTVAGRQVHFTATEYKLLTELSTAAGRLLTHEQLLRRVWGPLYASDARIVRQYVKEVRHKLGDDAARPTYIFTEPGVGYRMAKPSMA